MPTLKEKNPASPMALAESAQTPGPAEVSAEELHVLLNSRDKSAVMVVDVRPADDFGTFHIPGSINKPFQELNFTQLVGEVAPHVKQEGFVLVFVSAQSPDVDDLAAREYMNEYSKTHNHPPGDGAVSILLGGVCGYVEKYPS
jgi:rhodanese-related sulfurtransferase